MNNNDEPHTCPCLLARLHDPARVCALPVNPQPTLPLLPQATCQKDYLSVPQGCKVAPDTTDSRFVVGNYNWNTNVVVLSSAKPYCTKNFATTSKACEGQGGHCSGCLKVIWWAYKNGQYKVRQCSDSHGQILYQCTDYTGTGDTTMTTITIAAPTSAPDLCHRPA